MPPPIIVRFCRSSGILCVSFSLAEFARATQASLCDQFARATQAPLRDQLARATQASLCDQLARATQASLCDQFARATQASPPHILSTPAPYATSYGLVMLRRLNLEL